MSEEFTSEELYNLIKFNESRFACGYDELLMLLAEYIDDDRVTKEIEKYVEMYDEVFRRDWVCLTEMKEKLDEHLIVIETLKGVHPIGTKQKELREKFLEVTKILNGLH